MKIGNNKIGKIRISERVAGALKEPSCHYCEIMGAYIFFNENSGWGILIALIGGGGMLIKAHRYENRHMWKAWLFLMLTCFLSLIFIDQFDHFLSFFSVYAVIVVVCEACQDIQYSILRDFTRSKP